jgi:hypothetical protein
MAEWSSSRLMVVGPKAAVKQFRNSDWIKTLQVQHVEELDWSQGLYICLLETHSAPVGELQALSRKWRNLTFLLDYHVESEHLKGLAKAKTGQLDYCQFHY